MTGKSQRDDSPCMPSQARWIAGALAGDETLDGRARDRQGQTAADHRVDADDAAASIDEWAAGVTGAQRHVGLQPISSARAFKGGGLAGGDHDTGCGRAA